MLIAWFHRHCSVIFSVGDTKIGIWFCLDVPVCCWHWCWVMLNTGYCWHCWMLFSLTGWCWVLLFVKENLGELWSHEKDALARTRVFPQAVCNFLTQSCVRSLPVGSPRDSVWAFLRWSFLFNWGSNVEQTLFKKSFDRVCRSKDPLITAWEWDWLEFYEFKASNFSPHCSKSGRYWNHPSC